MEGMDTVEEDAVEKEPVKTEPCSSVQSYDRSQLPNLLRIYYSWLFPYDKYFEWLQYGNPDTFSHREFSFALEDDVYVRYQSYDNLEGLEAGIRKFQPYKIDIGAIFSVKPCMRNRVQQASFKALRKELVFDIDMTDYDEIRTCCREANICPKCWKFMTIAIKILDRALREDFGFKHLLWVYSGRRGIHCWVCDEAAIQLSQDARVAIVEYLTLVRGGEQQVQKVKLKGTMHPSISSALKIVDKCFDELLIEQEFLETPEQWNKILALVPQKTRESLNEEWSEHPDMTSLEKWKRLQFELKDKPQVLQEIKLQWSYPRLDVNVSKGINHLLKSPLCVHPKTGRICVPIDIQNVDSFDPFSVPTVSQICEEFDQVKAEGGPDKPQKAYMKTSLGPYMVCFSKRFLYPLMQAVNKEKRKGHSLVF